MAIEHLDHATFVDLLGTTFTVGDLALVLVEVSEVRSSPSTEAFSILFHGPRTRLLAQGEHAVRHERIGEFRLFTVPVGEDVDHFHYEAVFNRRRTAS